MTRFAWFALPLVAACSSSSSEPSTPPAQDGDDAASEVATDGPRADVRGARYCEVLLAKAGSGTIHIDVYNTYGLNDCPEDLWSKLDASAIQTDTGSDSVVLNGPRYWMIDSFADSVLLDKVPRSFGGLSMRLAGTLDFPATDIAKLKTPYVPKTVARKTTWVMYSGKPVFELLDDAGHVYTMQSYSVQTEPQTESSLASLGSKLKLPTGWSFRTRVLDADLPVHAVDDKAVVVNDELNNTYQQSN